MGQSLARLLADLGVPVAIKDPAFPTAFALAVRDWKIEPHEAVVAYLWSWLENQVMAAIKAVPLGQTAGQKMLLSLGERLDALADLPLAKPPGATSPPAWRICRPSTKPNTRGCSAHEESS